MKNDDLREIADLLIPELPETTDSIESRYPSRELAEGVRVTRFGPSPTGFLHIGGLFAALISERVAHATDGVFFLRIEDTDKKREVENGVTELTSVLSKFGIRIDEGLNGEGKYGPYVQSQRADIYRAYARKMIEEGNAYPCFCTSEELEEARKKQEGLKIRPGYYGEWAVHRNLSPEEIRKNISDGKSFVIRLKSPGSVENSFKFTDEIKGDVSVTENDQDIVLLKSDGIPTYHFAHVVDDHLMGTTHVLRGDEWLSSLPIHLQLFRIMGWKAPKYGHIAPILKSDNGTKRKLSKRKDPEAAVEYYFKEGYPNEAVVEYLLNIANSDFEDWRKANPTAANEKFEIKLKKFSKSGALFDINKLANISKDVIARMSLEQTYDLALAWANEYDAFLAEKLISEKDYFIKIISIERDSAKPRKDFGKWSDVREGIFFFFDDLFGERNVDFMATLNENQRSVAKELLTSYAERYVSLASALPDRDAWFADFKEFAGGHGFAIDPKEYKANPQNFKGGVGDAAMILRVALTTKTQTPDLFEMMQVLGTQKVSDRLNKAASLL